MRFQKMIMMVLCCAFLTGVLAGCGSSTDTKSGTESSGLTKKTTPASESSEETTKIEGSNLDSKNGKALVVYYSATGNTKVVGDTIAQTLGADTFEIVPTEPYTDEELDWTNSDSRVSKEHDNPDIRNVELTATTVDNWESYDTVFIGYPIWWGIAAWPVDNFVKANDFTGKTVIPFSTSSSSGLGESGELLSDMAGTGDWQEGERFRSGASNSDVSEWANSVMQ